MSTDVTSTHDVVIVGSGAGGGPLAANLAHAGLRVLLLEAGDDHPCPYYDVPVFHAHASEHADVRWDYFVRHYADGAQQHRDSKFVPERDGVLYPRGGTLGGSTAVSAMITIAVHHGDWDHIAELTGDPSWSAESMWAYFQRLEHWDPPPGSDGAEHPVDPASRHGGAGWLHTTRAAPAIGGREPQWLAVFEAMEQHTRADLGPERANGLDLPLDPNDWRTLRGREEGMAVIPVAVKDGQRNGSRERIRAAERDSEGRLEIRLNALVTRVLIEGGRAVGVEYREGESLYRADPRATPATAPGAEPGTLRRALADREVVLAAGAFNTPQLLKLSGIGPAAELRAHGIDVLADAPGVGENLQDRYEVAIVSATKEPFSIFHGSGFDIPNEPGDDPLFTEWERRDGPYTTNGSLAAYIKRSAGAAREPDVFVFALPVAFTGYYPGYATDFTAHTDRLTFVVLKAHTENRAGSVTLRSADPTDTPQILFRYFEEGSDAAGKDLDGVVEGIELARALARRLGPMIDRELVPGPQVADRNALKTFVRDEAWGHHASCTCPIGADGDPMAVLDSEFRVRGINALRVVDASVFPRIPGFFIASAVYMISEKASDLMIRHHAPQHS